MEFVFVLLSTEVLRSRRTSAIHFGVWLKRGARKECNSSAFVHGSGALSAF